MTASASASSSSSSRLDAPTLPYLTLESHSTLSALLRPPSTAVDNSQAGPSRRPGRVASHPSTLEPLNARFRLPDLVAPSHADHDSVLASFLARQRGPQPQPALNSLPTQSQRQNTPGISGISASLPITDPSPSHAVHRAQPSPPEPHRSELLSWDDHRLNGSKPSSKQRTQLMSEMASSPQSNELDEAVLESITPLPASALLDSKRAPQPAPSYPLPSVQASLLQTLQGHASTHFAWDAPSATFVWSGKHHLRLQRMALKREARKGKERESSSLRSRLDDVPTWVGSERIYGLSSQASESLVARFLGTGSMLRRLGDCASRLMEQGRRGGAERVRATTPPEAYALAGATQEVLAWVAEELKAWAERHQASGETLLRAWSELETMERLLTAMADMFHCGMRRSPPFRSVLPPLPEGSKSLAQGSSSAFILSQLYAHLVAASEAQEPLLVRAVLGWLMERTSQGWRSGVAAWIGMWDAQSAMEGLDSELTEGVVRFEPWAGAEMEKALNERGEEDAGYIIRPARVPSFVNLSDARDLLEAGRALRLLRKAAPEGHPLLRALPDARSASASSTATRLPSWLASPTEQEALLTSCLSQSRQIRIRIAQWRSRRSERLSTSSAPSMSLRGSTTAGAPSLRGSEGPTAAAAAAAVSPSTFGLSSKLLSGDAGPGLRALAPREMLSLFDKAPDAEDVPPALVPRPSSSSSSLRSILSDILSRRSPADDGSTLLRGPLSIQPFLAWSRLVNNALTSVYFRDLALATYLDVCQRFLLLGSPFFTSRISECLFSDVWESGGGVGLSQKLNEAPTWPPSSASISSILTAAILESVQEMRGGPASPLGIGEAKTTKATSAATNESESHGQALRDLDERLSFAIVRPDWLVRNSDEARAERWKDRRAIEALDWLTLSFQPPPLIAPLLTAQAQMCYQRLFTFLLRLIRVQTAMRGLWRSSVLSRRQGGSERLLPDSRQAAHLRLLLALAHQARSFVNAYHAYVVHQLGRSWASFMARLNRLREDAEARDEDGARAAAVGEDVGAGEDDGDALSDRDGAQTVVGSRTSGGGGGDIDDGDEDDEERKPLSSYQLKDIFSIARYHESLLNGMLESCFLRHRQRGVSRIVSDLLGLCLTLAELGSSAEPADDESETEREEAQHQRLEALAHRFRSKLSLLARALQLFRDRGGAGGGASSRRGAVASRSLGFPSAYPHPQQRGAAKGSTTATTTTTMGRQEGAASAEMARQEAEAEQDLRALEQDVRKSALHGDEALTALIDALSA